MIESAKIQNIPDTGTELALRAGMKLKIIILAAALSVYPLYTVRAQSADTRKDSTSYFPHPIANVLPSSYFIPPDRLQGLTQWMGGPVSRPTVHVMPVYGFNGYGFGKLYVDHWEKFFANLLSYNSIDTPQLLDTQVMMVGNTISLGKKRRLYLSNGILYGRHYGIWGNMIGMGSREGLIFKPNGWLVITVWSQEYQSVYAYSPVVYPYEGEGTASVKLPASPVMVSYGAQASFLAGQFWIGLGASLWHQARPEH